MSKTLRYQKSENKYTHAKLNNLLKDLRDEIAIKEFKYFKIIVAAYPHDRIAAVHHLLVPKRKINHWTKMNWKEKREFRKIDTVTSKEYDCIKLNYPSKITVPEIVHWHLYKLK